MPSGHKQASSERSEDGLIFSFALILAIFLRVKVSS